MSNRNLTYIKNAIKYCQNILDIRAAHEPTYEAFLNDIGYQYAVSFCIEQIGELVKKLREEGYADKYPNIPWNKIAGMRNVVAHAYATIDLETVYGVATANIPELLKEFEQILQQESSLEDKIAEASEIQASDKQEQPARKNRGER